MRTYPKIDTLFERDAEFRVTDVLRRPVFADISRWIVTEKIDGTNIRIGATLGEPNVVVGGRSDNAQIPADLVCYLNETFSAEKMQSLFIAGAEPGANITLFGEGYGAGIQRGGDYLSTKAFILFDALIEIGGSAYWQDDDTVTDFAARMGVVRVPVLGEWSLDEIINAVKSGIQSQAAITPRLAEGVVARTREPLFDRRGRRLILKLKTSDFSAGVK